MLETYNEMSDRKDDKKRKSICVQCLLVKNSLMKGGKQKEITLLSILKIIKIISTCSIGEIINKYLLK